MNSHLNSNPGNAEAGGKRTLGTTAPVQWLSSMVPYSTIVPCSCSTTSTSIISLDLARRLKLKVEPRGELLLNGIDGVKTKVTNKCRVKIALGHRVVHTLDVWVGNICQCIDVLLGMNFMVAAGVRFTKRVPVAARVVNISRRPVQVLPHTKVATLTDRDRLPLGTNFVRPGSYQYDE
ncbi:hypothetical protein PHMEG_00028625 [Phytophthora megakarya]|uniref:Eukaryotic/viral aspartic protease n=1 Tax=Phytophthora megakarya TaxID=4795 RepID=A0A225V4H7_9STRA|nr:hypothetical protein PHMEG_00028625 [Phytophthora megakarya]